MFFESAYPHCCKNVFFFENFVTVDPKVHKIGLFFGSFCVSPIYNDFSRVYVAPPPQWVCGGSH